MLPDLTNPPSLLLGLCPPFFVIICLQDLRGEAIGLSQFREVGGGVAVIWVGVVAEPRGEEVWMGCGRGKAWICIMREECSEEDSNCM